MLRRNNFVSALLIVVITSPHPVPCELGEFFCMEMLTNISKHVNKIAYISLKINTRLFKHIKKCTLLLHISKLFRIFAGEIELQTKIT